MNHSNKAKNLRHLIHIAILCTLCLLASLLISSCNNNSSNNITTETACTEPLNPYTEGTGHYAGFNWAQTNQEDCDGNSESFNEGCEEYYNQLDEYNECAANKT